MLPSRILQYKRPQSPLTEVHKNQIKPPRISQGWRQLAVAHALRGTSPVALVVKNPTNAGDARGAASIPGSGRSPGGGNGNPFQYSCLENPKDRGTWRAIVWRAIVHGATKSVRRLSNWKHNACIMWRWAVFPQGLHTHSREMILPQATSPLQGFPGGSVVKNLFAMQEMQVQSLGWEDPPGERRKWQPTPVFLPGKIHWTEEPGGATVHGSQKNHTRLSQTATFPLHSPFSFHPFP